MTLASSCACQIEHWNLGVGIDQRIYLIMSFFYFFNESFHLHLYFVIKALLILFLPDFGALLILFLPYFGALLKCIDNN
jgi:hypothetical protein